MSAATCVERIVRNNQWANGLGVRYLLWVALNARDPGFESQLAPFCHLLL